MKSKPTPFGVPKRLDPPPRVEGVWAPEGYRLVRTGTVAAGDLVHVSGNWTEAITNEIGEVIQSYALPIARRIEPRVSTAAEVREIHQMIEADRERTLDETDAQATRAYVDALTAHPIVTFRNVTFVGNPSTDDFYAPFDWPDTTATPRIEVPRRIAKAKKPKNAPLTEAQRAIAFPGPRKMIKLT